MPSYSLDVIAAAARVAAASYSGYTYGELADLELIYEAGLIDREPGQQSDVPEHAQVGGFVWSFNDAMEALLSAIVGDDVSDLNEAA